MMVFGIPNQDQHDRQEPLTNGLTVDIMEFSMT